MIDNDQGVQLDTRISYESTTPRKNKRVKYTQPPFQKEEEEDGDGDGDMDGGVDIDDGDSGGDIGGGGDGSGVFVGYKISPPTTASSTKKQYILRILHQKTIYTPHNQPNPHIKDA